MRRRLLKTLMVSLSAGLLLTGCGNSKPEVGSIKGYDKGEEYLSIWVHSIEDTDEGQAYKESVNTFNKKYNGKYFADIEFIPRNDSGGGYSDKINASVMSGGLPDVLTVDGHAMDEILSALSKASENKGRPTAIIANTVK